MGRRGERSRKYVLSHSCSIFQIQEEEEEI